MTPTFDYPGNTWLPEEVRERVLSTFRHSLQLFKSGNVDEVRAGCELLLKMDPLFDPAKKLLEATRNPAAVSMAELESALPKPESGSLLDAAREAFAARDFRRAAELAARAGADEEADAAQILQDATERIEAEPFVRQFASNARKHLESGNTAAARTAIEKARVLDADHPDVVALIGALGTPSAQQPLAAAPEPPLFQPGVPTYDEEIFSAPIFGQQASEESFVVDSAASPPAPAAAAAVSEFGFTFEEAPGQDFSTAGAVHDFSFGMAGNTAPAAPPAPDFHGSFEPVVGEAQTFDFTTAAIDTTPQDQEKIRRYLAEGDSAWAAGEITKAIDVWSRVFLIDVTNEQASERIERARAEKTKLDQKIEDLLAQGMDAFDRRESEAARQAFQEVLTHDPDNRAAADYLGRLSGRAGEAPPPTAPPSFAPESDSGLYDEMAAEEVSSSFEPLMPPTQPELTAEPAAAPQPARPAKKKASIPVGLIAAVLGAVVLLGAAWMGYSRFFGGGANPEKTRAAIAEARQLGELGQYDRAIALLTAVSPKDSMHQSAVELIAELKIRKGEEAALIGGRPAQEVYDGWVARGLTAMQTRDHLTAKEAFDQAAAIKPLSPELQAQANAAAQQVAKLDSARILFKEANYAGAIANLQSLLEQEPDNANARQLLSNAHFNLGVMALQEEKLALAENEFAQVLSTNPNDMVARRSRELAVRYSNEPTDLLYRIYVKHLAMR
jgi:tetratricopeptide (TPR) repeat protein